MSPTGVGLGHIPHLLNVNAQRTHSARNDKFLQYGSPPLVLLDPNLSATPQLIRHLHQLLHQFLGLLFSLG